MFVTEANLENMGVAKFLNIKCLRVCMRICITIILCMCKIFFLLA